MSVRFAARALGCTVAAVVLGLATTSAEAAAVNPYVRVDAGIALSTSAGGDIFNGTGFGNDFGNTAAFDVGGGLSVPVGALRLRGEIELGYDPNFESDHSATNPANGTVLSTHTKVRLWTSMVNVYADLATDSRFSPYVGLGIGGGYTHLNQLTYAFNGAPAAIEPGGNQTNLAWSATAGVGYKVSDTVTLDLEYRYLDAGRVQSSGTVVFFNNGPTLGQPPLRSDLKTHQLTAGIRYGF